MREKHTATSIYTSVKGAAQRYDVADCTIRELINTGRLPAYRFSDKPGSAIRIKITDLEALMKPVIPAELRTGSLERC
ncbi:excisionase family DNA-binding protein [Mycobacterium barrassiae]|uniref:excisionase family DNA-binding protein n=1 Tax=Mycobacterium barrassiae TaxID=319709 RepID=UPI002265AFDC|nr:excisionase family DNA-binding protein [Mycobacterium barrassiae]MCV7302630.1 excisionase family DNA-binding protein [Mycobacterium barrassiae]